MNWGHGVTIGFVLFAGYILYFVFVSFNRNFDLVSDDYYAQEVAFQDRIDDTKNGLEIKDEITIKHNDNQLEVNFPIEVAKQITKGNIHFFRPSDKKLDLEISLDLDENGLLSIPLEKFVQGRYEAQISWDANGKSYYVKKDIFI